MLHFLFHCLLMIFVLFKLWCLSFWHIYIGAVYTTTVGEGNGKPIQYSCLENPMDGGTLWAAICGVTQSRTQLKWLSSSSSILRLWLLHQFSSAAQLCLPICDPMDCSTPGFPIRHQLLELAQTHVHRVGDAIQPSHPVFTFSSCLQSFPASGCGISHYRVSPSQTPSIFSICWVFLDSDSEFLNLPKWCSQWIW